MFVTNHEVVRLLRLNAHLAALDVGSTKVGVALAPYPWHVVSTTTLRTDARGRSKLSRLLTQAQVDLMVVGWPLELSGRAGARCDEVAKFINHFETPATRVDERFSTQAVRGNKFEDEAAAALILETFLKRSTGPGR